MFTGIITETGIVTELTHHAGEDSARLSLQAPDSAVDLPTGGSLAVSGVCLTAVEVEGPHVTVDVMGETLRRSTLGALRSGDRVNLERCVPAHGRLDGHLVQGHVEGTGTVATVQDHGTWRGIRIELPAGLGRYLAEKGSVAVDGVSLTVTAVNDPAGQGPDWFEVGIIPATAEHTTLGRSAPGTVVNIEVDVMAKYIERLTAYDRTTAEVNA